MNAKQAIATPFAWVCGWELAECTKHVHWAGAPWLALAAFLVSAALMFSQFYKK